MLLYNLPIEPLEERYSNQWRAYFAEAFNADSRFKVRNVDVPTLTLNIETGSFLDVYGTNYFKCEQMALLARILHGEGKPTETEWVFFHDLWNPCVSNLAYMRDGTKRRINIAGCLHAGTWDKNDFLVRQRMSPWAWPLERSILETTDLVFVATQYHKDLIQKSHGNYYASKVHVTGFPIKPQVTHPLWEKKDPSLVVFPHRLDPEKRPDLFSILEVQATARGFQCVRTKEACKTKAEYYDMLEKASFAISFAEQETWGIAMQEAVFAGCVPLVPDRLSYQEMYHTMFRYGHPGEVIDKMVGFRSILSSDQVHGPVNSQQVKFESAGRNAISNMIQLMIEDS